MAARTPARRRWTWAAAAASTVVIAGIAAFGPGREDARPAPAAAAPPEAQASAPPTPAAAPVSAPPAPQPNAAPAASTSEEDLMARLRLETDDRPAVALQLVDEGEGRFPAGRYADERAYLRMRALVHLGEIGLARADATEFFQRHPDSAFARSVFRLTGVHPVQPPGPPR